MSEKVIDDGGAAFPYQPGDWVVNNTGMTLRQYYAGQALGCAQWLGGPEDIAKGCYEVADAMIAEGKHTSGEGGC